MSSVNKVILIGRLGNDPEVKHTHSGLAVATINLATNEMRNDKQTGQRQETTEWHRVVFFERQAEVVGEYLRKGSQIYIEGRLQTRKWQDKNGVDRWSTEIIASNMQMLGSRADASSSIPSAPTEHEDPISAQPENVTDHKQPIKNFDDDVPF